MVKIITDTTACLPPDIKDEFDIPVVPQLIHFGDDTYQEGIDLDHSGFLKRLRSSSALPKTAAPPPDLFCEIFQKYQHQEEIFLCIHPSTDLSGTVRSATVARQDFPDEDIRVLDTRLVASPLGSVVHQAAIAARNGLPADEIESMVTSLSNRCRIFFLVPTLEYLARGGRIGGASALVGNVLNIKPILSLENGRIEAHSKERTLSRAMMKLKKLVITHYPDHQDAFLSIMHADDRQTAQDIADDLVNKLSIPDPLITDLPPAIITHAGPGTLAVGFFSQT